MIDLVLGLETAVRPRTGPSSCRDVADRRAEVRGALLAADRRRARNTADPRPRNPDLFENGFNQVTEATGPDGTTTFTWDDNGNQTEKAEPGGATTEYTWDAMDRLTEIALPDGTTATYGYDTNNLRVSMDDDADGARRILLDGLEEHGEVDEATGERVARFDHDPTRIDALLAQTTDAGRVAMLTDALGSVYGLTDDAAVIRARYAYDVYGARAAELEEIATRWGFTGRPLGTGLAYLRSRFIAPATAGFLSRDIDPDRRDAPSLYWYVRQTPTLLRDPMGLFALFLDLGTCSGQLELGVSVGLARVRAVLVANSGRRLSYQVERDGAFFRKEFAFDGLAYPPAIAHCVCAADGSRDVEIFGQYRGMTQGPFGRTGDFDIFLPAAAHARANLGVGSTLDNLSLALLHEWTHAAVDVLWMSRKQAEEDAWVPYADGVRGFPRPLIEWIAQYAEVVALDIPLPRGGNG